MECSRCGTHLDLVGFGGGAVAVVGGGERDDSMGDFAKAASSTTGSEAIDDVERVPLLLLTCSTTSW